MFFKVDGEIHHVSTSVLCRNLDKELFDLVVAVEPMAYLDISEFGIPVVHLARLVEGNFREVETPQYTLRSKGWGSHPHSLRVGPARWEKTRFQENVFSSNNFDFKSLSWMKWQWLFGFVQLQLGGFPLHRTTVNPRWIEVCRSLETIHPTTGTWGGEETRPGEGWRVNDSLGKKGNPKRKV